MSGAKVPEGEAGGEVSEYSIVVTVGVRRDNHIVDVQTQKGQTAWRVAREEARIRERRL